MAFGLPVTDEPMEFASDGTLRERCGFAAWCGRWLGHTGHHGGWQTRIRVAEPGTHELLCGHGLKHSLGSEFSAREVQVLAEYAEHGNIAAAAACLGLSVQTAKNHLAATHERAGVRSSIEVFRALGWLRVPRGSVRHEPFEAAS